MVRPRWRYGGPRHHHWTLQPGLHSLDQNNPHVPVGPAGVAVEPWSRVAVHCLDLAGFSQEIFTECVSAGMDAVGEILVASWKSSFCLINPSFWLARLCSGLAVVGVTRVSCTAVCAE